MPIEEAAVSAPTLPKYAKLDWIQQQPDELNELPDIIELARARQPKEIFKPAIMTLPQTEESQALHEWLSVAPSPVGKYSTPRPDYAAMTVKQLRVEARISNVKNASTLTKKSLVAALQAA